VFLPKNAYDHSVMIIQLGPPPSKFKTSFKFLNLWADMDDFLDLVGDTLQTPVDENPMYKFIKRLDLLKPKLKSLHHHHTSHISSRVVEAKAK
jgi:hypothetical protein